MRNTEKVDFSVVICTYTEKRWEDLVAAVRSVMNQTLPASEIIVVVDHNPPLLERVQVELPDTLVLANEEEQGLAGGRNTGVKAASGEVVAFLDDDAIAEADWLEQLQAAYSSDEIAGVGGLITPLWAEDRPGWFPPEFDWVVGCSYRGLPQESSTVRNLIGANMSFRRKLFELTDGFRNGMGRVGTRPLGCEETEFCIRVQQLVPGSRFIYQPSAQVHHRVGPERTTWRYFSSRCYSEGLSKALVSQLVGRQAGLATETAYVSRTLRQAFLRNIRQAFRQLDLNPAKTAAAIVAGLLITAIGYLVGLLRFKPVPVKQDGPLKILMVTPRYLPLTGGVETHVYEVARRLASSGHSVTVLTTDRTGQLPPFEEKEGVQIRRVRAWPRNRDYYFAPALYRLIGRGRWDVVHVQSYHTLVAPLAMLAALRAKIPFVVTFHSGGHSSALRSAGRGPQRMVLKPLLKRAARLIGVSRFEASFFQEKLNFPAERFKVIPNGAQLPELSNAGVAQSDRLVVSIGRLERYKGHQRVIAALPAVLKQYPEVQLRIVGNGPYEADLQRQVQGLGLTGKVQIEGISAEDREGMARLLNQARLVTLLSEYEAHPVAVMEALSLQRPVLVSDTSGLSELAEKGLVRAIPLKSSPAEVARAIIAELENPPAPVEIELPDWEKCANDLLDLYLEVTGRA